MKVHEVMSQDISFVLPDTSFRDLWREIFKKHINSMPVIDKKKRLVGIVTKDDLLKLFYPAYQEYFEDFTSVSDFEEMEKKIHEMASVKVKDIMNKRVIFTRHDTPIMRALSRMIARSVNQLPVLSYDDTLIGVVTKGDIFYALFRRHLTKKHMEEHEKLSPHHHLEKTPPKKKRR